MSLSLARVSPPDPCLTVSDLLWPPVRSAGEEYTLAKSYEKEERLKLRDPDNLLLSTLEELLDGDRR